MIKIEGRKGRTTTDRQKTQTNMVGRAPLHVLTTSRTLEAGPSSGSDLFVQADSACPDWTEAEAEGKKAALESRASSGRAGARPREEVEPAGASKTTTDSTRLYQWTTTTSGWKVHDPPRDQSTRTWPTKDYRTGFPEGRRGRRDPVQAEVTELVPEGKNWFRR